MSTGSRPARLVSGLERKATQSDQVTVTTVKEFEFQLYIIYFGIIFGPLTSIVPFLLVMHVISLELMQTGRSRAGRTPIGTGGQTHVRTQIDYMHPDSFIENVHN